MIDVAFFLEEPSAQDFLQGFLAQHYPNIRPRFVVFEGKSDLEKRLGSRLRAWLDPKPRFFVIRDQDSGDCKAIKERLEKICREANVVGATVCIACRELESWYLGDLESVGKALQLPGLVKLGSKAKFRDPDNATNAKQLLVEVTHRKYQERSGSRAIGLQMGLNNNRSQSFLHLNKKLQSL